MTNKKADEYYSRTVRMRQSILSDERMVRILYDTIQHVYKNTTLHSDAVLLGSNRHKIYGVGAVNDGDKRVHVAVKLHPLMLYHIDQKGSQLAYDLIQYEEAFAKGGNVPYFAAALVWDHTSKGKLAGLLMEDLTEGGQCKVKSLYVKGIFSSFKREDDVYVIKIKDGKRQRVFLDPPIRNCGEDSGHTRYFSDEALIDITSLKK